MGISGCTACQAGGQDALQAYDRAYQSRLDQQRALNAPLRPALAPASENRPLASGTLGTQINLSA